MAVEGKSCVLVLVLDSVEACEALDKVDVAIVETMSRVLVFVPRDSDLREARVAVDRKSWVLVLVPEAAEASEALDIADVALVEAMSWVLVFVPAASVSLVAAEVALVAA